VTGIEPFQPLAVVFDLDGTLADNMDWHARAFATFVARHHLPALTPAIRRRIDGKRNAEIMPILFERDLPRAEIEALASEKEELYRCLSKGAIRPVKGLLRLLDALRRHGIPSAVATSAPRPNVAYTLAELGLTGRFDAVALSDDVPRGKPAPDVFLLAARLLGVEPSRCLAFEDAPVGVTAARAAGMRCLALTSTFPSEAFETSDPRPDGLHADFDTYLAGEGGWLTEPQAGDEPQPSL
jgi:HAD superfamily hydrolase (TIGR01509 family)